MPDRAILGPYALLRPLCSPQVGTAFLAVQRGQQGFEKPVVLHCRPRRHLEAVAVEAMKAARLSHAGIAHVLDVGLHQDLAYVAVEHVEGSPLHAILLRRGRLPWRSVARVAAEIARALGYAHGRRDERGDLLRIVHRRISPRRIVLGSEGSVRLTGFGISWAWPNPIGYGSPEEHRGEPVDGRADVYATGLVLRRSATLDGAPAVFSELLEWMTHPLPEHRPTAAELHAALREMLHGTAGGQDRRHDLEPGLGC